MDKEKIIRVPVADISKLEGKIQILEALTTTMTPMSIDNGTSYDEVIFLDDVHSHLTYLRIIHERLLKEEEV